MREVLVVDCCVRGEASRTARLVRAFVSALDPEKYHVTVVDPAKEGLRPLTAETLRARDGLLARGRWTIPLCALPGSSPGRTWWRWRRPSGT